MQAIGFLSLMILSAGLYHMSALKIGLKYNFVPKVQKVYGFMATTLTLQGYSRKRRGSKGKLEGDAGFTYDLYLGRAVVIAIAQVLKPD